MTTANKTTIRFITHLFLGFLLLCIPCEVYADIPSVVWSGVGFTGDWENRHRYYPETSSFFEQENRPLEVWARERILKATNYPFEIKFGSVDEGDLDQIALAITISREAVMHEKIIVNGKTKFLENYSLSGSAIFFSLETNKLISSAPLITRYSRVYEAPPTQEERLIVFKTMLSSDELGINFFDEMSKKLTQVQLSSLPSQYIQIRGFDIDPTVHPSVANSPDIDLFSSYLSTFFENRLLSESGISLIPNRVGHAIGNKIATRLPSGDRTITLPDPGYTIDLRIHKLIYQKKPNKITDSLCWGGVLSLTATSHLFGDEELSKIGFRDINCAAVDKDMALDDYTEYQKLMMGILDGLAQQFNATDSKWLKEKALDKKQAKTAINMLAENFKATMF